MGTKDRQLCLKALRLNDVWTRDGIVMVNIERLHDGIEHQCRNMSLCMSVEDSLQ